MSTLRTERLCLRFVFLVISFCLGYKFGAALGAGLTLRVYAIVVAICAVGEAIIEKLERIVWAIEELEHEVGRSNWLV